MATEKRLIDLTGQRFGKLVVISRESKYNRNATWQCLCDCGKETVVRGDVLCRGTTQSCGCGKGLKHGHFKKPWYSSYKAMMERCYLPSNGNYMRYGGKGVTVCDEWHDINKFAEWVETSGYAPCLTIDRIDPRGNYEPNNCRWLTRSENSKKQFEDRKARTKEMVEVVHGRWECEHETWGRLQCSNCKNEALLEKSIGDVGTILLYVTSNFCPNCGADKRGDGNV